MPVWVLVCCRLTDNDVGWWTWHVCGLLVRVCMYFDCVGVCVKGKKRERLCMYV